MRPPRVRWLVKRSMDIPTITDRGEIVEQPPSDKWPVHSGYCILCRQIATPKTYKLGLVKSRVLGFAWAHRSCVLNGIERVKRAAKRKEKR